MHTKKLEEFGISIIGGQIIRRIEVENPEFETVEDSSRKTVVAKTVGYGLIEEQNIVIKDYKNKVDDAKYTKKGDIVIKLSAPYNAAYITEENEDMLVSSFCAIIRSTEHIDPYFLLACLNSEFCQKQLIKSVSGALIGILNSTKLKSLEIPFVNEQKQKEIGNLFKRTIENKVTMQKILLLEEERINAFIEILGEE